MQKEIRQPVQQRSIETKRKIITAGYFLFAKNGFFKTNTAQIAKEAQVSTGIVYGYFQDKKDILKEVINEYVETDKNNNQIIINCFDKKDIPSKKAYCFEFSR